MKSEKDLLIKLTSPASVKPGASFNASVLLKLKKPEMRKVNLNVGDVNTQVELFANVDKQVNFTLKAPIDRDYYRLVANAGNSSDYTLIFLDYLASQLNVSFSKGSRPEMTIEADVFEANVITDIIISKDGTTSFYSKKYGAFNHSSQLYPEPGEYRIMLVSKNPEGIVVDSNSRIAIFRKPTTTNALKFDSVTILIVAATILVFFFALVVNGIGIFKERF